MALDATNGNVLWSYVPEGQGASRIKSLAIYRDMIFYTAPAAAGELNPVIALDARVAVAPIATKRAGTGHPRFSIRPYPSDWERHIAIDGIGNILVRPVRPEDEALYPEFFSRVSPDDMP